MLHETDSILPFSFCVVALKVLSLKRPNSAMHNHAKSITDNSIRLRARKLPKTYCDENIFLMINSLASYEKRRRARSAAAMDKFHKTFRGRYVFFNIFEKIN